MTAVTHWNGHPSGARADSARRGGKGGPLSVQSGPPVGRDTPPRTGHGLVDGVVLGWGQVRPGHFALGREVPEPVLPGFVAAHHGMAGRRCVAARVLAR